MSPLVPQPAGTITPSALPPRPALLSMSVSHHQRARGQAGFPNPAVSAVLSWEQAQLNGSQDALHLHYLISPGCICSVSAPRLVGDSCAQ